MPLSSKQKHAAKLNLERGRSKQTNISKPASVGEKDIQHGPQRKEALNPQWLFEIDVCGLLEGEEEEQCEISADDMEEEQCSVALGMDPNSSSEFIQVMYQAQQLQVQHDQADKLASRKRHNTGNSARSTRRHAFNRRKIATEGSQNFIIGFLAKKPVSFHGFDDDMHGL